MHQGENNAGPFGRPDGANGEIEDLQQEFISFSNTGSELATREDDSSVRVIVGRKGSGKTVYLRRLHAYTVGRDDRYALPIKSWPPSNQTIIKFCQWYGPDILTENWQLLWKAAILRSLTSHLLKHPHLNKYVNSEHTAELSHNYNELYSPFEHPQSPYSQIQAIIEGYTKNQTTKLINHPKWADLEWVLTESIKNCPPIYFYIDAVDEEFAHAPMYWLRCQKGLFYTVMRYLRDHPFGSKLHIVICMRDVVLASVYRSEHATRYRDSKSIKVLDWDESAIKYFLKKKIEGLPEQYFATPRSSSGKNIQNWTGVEAITNKARNSTEPVMDYLLRHTRLLPRDVVVLGNLLCKSIYENTHAANLTPPEDVVRNSVNDAAKIFADEQLAICSNEIVSGLMPKHAVEGGFSEFYTGNKEFATSIVDELVALLRVFGKDRFTFQDLQIAKELALSRFGEESDAFSVLWQNGMIGYFEPKQSKTLFSRNRLDDFKLPLSKSLYVLHSCLMHSIGGPQSKQISI